MRPFENGQTEARRGERCGVLVRTLQLQNIDLMARGTILSFLARVSGEIADNRSYPGSKDPGAMLVDSAI